MLASDKFVILYIGAVSTEYIREVICRRKNEKKYPKTKIKAILLHVKFNLVLQFRM